jgi:guanylate kinase
MVLVISAPSGAGKTTLINRLLKSDENFIFSVSTTTRPMRSYEMDGFDYNFVAKDVFLDMIENDEFIEWAEVYGNYYGTTKKEVDRIRKSGKIPLFDVDIQGAKNLRASLEGGVYIFIIPPSTDILRERLIGRKTESDDQLSIRLANARHEISEYSIFDYVIVNYDIEDAFKKMIAIISAEKCRINNMETTIRSILEGFNDYTA